ncbi:hypothetical protein BGX27_007077 [Mortierella sp. AM989]|nr:hypothetical protein BGX27_007077 [Mortierella sp. AM989]
MAQGPLPGTLAGKSQEETASSLTSNNNNNADNQSGESPPAVDRLSLGSPATTIAPFPVDGTDQQTTKANTTEVSSPYAASALSATLSSTDIGNDIEVENTALGDKGLQQQQKRYLENHHQIKETPPEDQMPSTSVANLANHLPHTPPSPVSTNPFRRSPSVSPPPNPTSTHNNIDFSGEDPFSFSAASSPNPAMSTAPALPARTAGAATPVAPLPSIQTTESDDPPDLPPPPAYELVAQTPASEVTIDSFAPQPTEPEPLPTPVSEVVQAAALPIITTPPSIPPRAPVSREPQPVNEYVLKPIDWIDPATGIEKRIKIITQNENGPCPLLALCNTLILQGKVAIQPYDRPAISYDHLLELLADYLLNEDPSETPSFSSPTGQRTGIRAEHEKVKSRLEIESALRLLPHLEHGLDVNVFFKSIRGFEPTAELSLFHTFGVELVHGWVVSPSADGPMFALVDGPAGISSYNKAVECIVSGDDAGGGLVVEDLRGNFTPITATNRSSESRSGVTQDVQQQNERITQALVVQEFMNATKTQLTSYGLHVLQESLPEGHLCAFFRNNHFCTLFKNPMDGHLYTLVTDQSLAHEQSIVWESLLSVDGAGDFLDGLFRHGALEVGDYARNNQPDSQHPDLGDGGGDEDFALALQLQQQEEEEEAQRVQRSKSRTSNTQTSNNRFSQSGSSNNNTYHPYETDEQMAARLHQEYLRSSQQQVQQQQQQQQIVIQPHQQYQPLNHQQSISRPYPAPQPGIYDQSSGYGTPQGQPYNPYHPGSTYSQPSQQSRSSIQSQRPDNVQGQSRNQSSHNRIQNSSGSSGGKKDKDDKCIIS